jgi:predicted metal-dependent hydrolase|tara:strand:- start:531 stop:959 length:429 start_codon:yes stop_codon:yes gene_type:complete
MIAFIILLILNLIILSRVKEPQALAEVKEKYRILRKHLIDTNNEKFHKLKQRVPISGFLQMNDTVGYNTNKGQEIALCLDGSANEIFHVLIHELTHSSVEEYSHSKKFWDNYIELRDICVKLGIYEIIPEKVEFCGQHIQDK